MLQLIGQKVGMTHIFADDGSMSALTFVKLYDNCVVDLKVNEGKEFDSLVLAFKKAEKAKKISKAQIGSFNKKGVSIHEKIKESRVKKGLEYKTNDIIDIDSVIKKGDMISISGVTIGKGFAGVMKRHNFAGLEASHGVSISHRSHGSTGQRQDPGKVFKGKKMAGHMGVDNVTVKNLKVEMVDKGQSIIAIRGAIPGNAGGDVVVKIAKI